MIDPELLQILRCPETHQTLAAADSGLIAALNDSIAAGRLRTRAGQPVTEKLDSGLVRNDGRFIYPVRRNIPVLLIDEAIPLTA